MTAGCANPFGVHLYYMTCIKLHTRLVGQPPTPEQLRLYSKPNMRGFFDDNTDPERFLATMILAMSLALPMDGSTFQRSVLLFPPNHEKWVIPRIKVLARHMLSTHSKQPLTYSLIVKLFQHVDTASRVLQIAEPARWASFGFGPSHGPPSWLRSRLLV